MKSALFAILCGIAFGATLSRSASAFSIAFEPDHAPRFEGVFHAQDSNGDGFITGAEVLSFNLSLNGTLTGGPSGWGVAASSARGDFLDLRYNLDGTLGDDAGEFLTFGQASTVTCTVTDPAPHFSSVTMITWATLSGLYNDAPTVGGVIPAPTASCDGFGHWSSPVAIFAPQVLTIIGATLASGPVPPSTVPVPGGLPLLGAALLTLAVTRRVRREDV